jgi:arsenate reductase (glutaredoxin)
MYTIYGIPNCDTIKKARTWFEKNNVPYQFYDYRKESLSAEKIKEWLAVFPWDKLVNKASTTWKELSEEEREAIVDGDSAIPLMMEKTTVIKRPLIETAGGKALTLGFNADVYASTYL